MGVTRKVLKQGNGADHPKAGDTVTIEYKGHLYDTSVGEANDFKGKVFDSTERRGDFKTAIGVGKVIRGWDEGVPQMSLGERAILTISSDYAYGERRGPALPGRMRGFYDLIPPNSSLVFEVELKGINDKRA